MAYRFLDAGDYEGWGGASQFAFSLMKVLDVEEKDSRTLIVWNKGKKAGYRVTVTRLSDGTTMTGFVKAS